MCTTLRIILKQDIIAAFMQPTSPSHGALLAAFAQHYTELVRYIARRTGCVEQARELAHDTWLRIAEREPPLQGPLLDPRAYVFTVSHNLVMNHLRRSNWIHAYLTECEQQALACAPHAPDVCDAAMYRQALVAVETALASLPERAREAYLAHGLHGDRQAEIASRLAVSVDTVKRDIAQANTAIEQALHAWRHTRVQADPPAASDGVRAGRRKSLTALLGLCAVGVGGTALWQQWQEQVWRYEVALATQRGRMLQRSLPDGTALTLDAQSRLDVNYSAAVRGILLHEGAAFFAVQKEPARAFVVQALGVKVTVLGTRFGVEIDGSQQVLVQVVSGLVRVEAHGQSTQLTAGQSLQVGAHATRLSTVAHPASWRSGTLDFDDVPLGDALARVARYCAMPLRATAAVAHLPISGTVRVADAWSWLASLPNVLPVRLRKHSDGSLELDRR